MRDTCMVEPISPVRLPTRLSAQQKVALAVIEQAFKDAADRAVTPAVRSEARRFIAGSVMLGEWCDVAGIDRAFMNEVAARFLRGLFDIVSSNRPARRGGREAGMRRGVQSRGQERRTAAAGMSASVVALRVSPSES